MGLGHRELGSSGQEEGADSRETATQLWDVWCVACCEASLHRTPLSRLALRALRRAGSSVFEGFTPFRVTSSEAGSRGSEFRRFSGSSFLEQTSAVSSSLSLSFFSNQRLEEKSFLMN